jgi:sortase B
MGYKLSAALRRIINDIISFVVLLCILISMAYALFALWDNHRIYQQAQDVQADMIKLKPDENGADGPSFEELLLINPDVKAWLSMENTKIDFPVLQGESNLSYINKDVYGNFALCGSIFLDCRNKPDFSDGYNILYGHHMEGGNMFGDLDKYREEKFFRENPHGELLLPGKKYELTTFAVLVIKASDENIFSPYGWEEQPWERLSFVKENALYIREEIFDSFTAEEYPQVLALTTCSGDFTDARTVLLTVMTPAA